MRKIYRKPLEPELRDELDGFRQKLADDASVGTDVIWKIFSKRKEGLLRHLLEEYNYKCCYCEVMLDSQGYPAIEHFKPKSKFRDLCFVYANLHVCCTRCNTNKGEKFSENLLSPTDDQPEDHLVFKSDVVVSGKTPRGTETVHDFLLLNNEDLKKARSVYLECVKERLEDVEALFGLLPDSKNHIRRKLEVLRGLMESENPFSLMIKDLFEYPIRVLENRLMAALKDISS